MWLEMFQLRTLAYGDPSRSVFRAADAIAEHSAERAATLTARLLAFSRRQALDPKAPQADRLVRDIGELLQRSIGEQVDLELVGSPGLWLALADPNELEQALLKTRGGGSHVVTAMVLVSDGMDNTGTHNSRDWGDAKVPIDGLGFPAVETGDLGGAAFRLALPVA